VSAEPFEDATSGAPRVRGVLHRPGTPAADALVLTHGAGSDCEAPLSVALATAFSARGVLTLRCDLPFRQARRRGPPPRGAAEADREGLRRAAEILRGIARGRLFLGGHSYGGRQASMLAAAQATVADALLLLSYPLHPPRRPAETRTVHLSSLRTPALFVHGDADPFGSLEAMRAALALIPARTRLVTIEGAGHELARSRPALDGLADRIVAAFLDWIGP